MKAIVCTSYGPIDQLEYKEIANPEIKPGEVLVEIRSASVNFPDTLIVQGLYQFKPEPPFVPGSDFSGVVKEVGSEVKHLKPGYEVVGFNPFGAFAEMVVAPGNVCFPKPPEMDFDIAASFSMVYGTSYHALVDRANLQEGETLLVLGAAGGVGLAAVEIGKLLGARVIAAASSDEKLQTCKEYGADETINYSTENLKERVKELTNAEGADVIFDPVGGALSEQALRATAWEGRFLVVGFAGGDIPKIPLNLPLLKGCQVVGVFWGSFAMRDPKRNMENSMKLVELFKLEKIKPLINQVYPLPDTKVALQEIADRKVRGKNVIKISG